MQQILVYADSLSWGIVPGTRHRLPFEQRWPGVMEHALLAMEQHVRVIEDCLNGRRTVWEDPFKPGRNGLHGLEQRIEVNSPLALVMLMLGTNDFQATHDNNAALVAQGIRALILAIRRAPIEPGMPRPPIMVVAPPPVRTAKGTMAEKFAGAERRAVGLAAAIETVAGEQACSYFDAGTVTGTSDVDGVHLDAEQHRVLGEALAPSVNALL
ncbi:MAG: SGNH/GDSL hydrolase family protein [Gammaproteobacteria bacterium]|nr:SGNH/GDSL hydrolase family protein [Gammaproteobacteria bacterium]